MPTDRTDSDGVAEKWQLIRRLDEQRAQVHAGVIDTWKQYKRGVRVGTGPKPMERTKAQQCELEIVVKIALHQLAERDRMEQSLKSK